MYDALNVLMAMKIIEKDKKEIRWKVHLLDSPTFSDSIRGFHQDPIVPYVRSIV